MPISVGCTECGRDYNVKNELMGKKFKCKDCGAVVAVPVAKKKPSTNTATLAKSSKSSPSIGSATKKPIRQKPKPADDDDFLDNLHSAGLEDGELYDADDEEASDEVNPPPVTRRKTGTAAKRPKKGTKSGSGASGILKFGGGSIGVLAVLGLIIRVIGAIGAGGGFGGALTWTEFSPPDGRYTVLMPGTARNKPQSNADGQITTTYLVETRNFACAVSLAQLPKGTGAVLKAMEPKTLIDSLLQHSSPQAKRVSERPVTLSGLPCHEVSFNDLGMRFTERFVVIGDDVFNAEFISKRDPPQAEMAKFFDSFRIAGVAGGAPTGAMPNAISTPGLPEATSLPGMPATPAIPGSGTLPSN